jgi:hypothetical protein
MGKKLILKGPRGEIWLLARVRAVARRLHNSGLSTQLAHGLDAFTQLAK